MRWPFGSEAISQTKDNDLHCNAVQYVGDEGEENGTPLASLKNDQDTMSSLFSIYLSSGRERSGCGEGAIGRSGV